jgi:hypothetical protein
VFIEHQLGTDEKYRSDTSKIGHAKIPWTCLKPLLLVIAFFIREVLLGVNYACTAALCPKKSLIQALLPAVARTCPSYPFSS